MKLQKLSRSVSFGVESANTTQSTFLHRKTDTVYKDAAKRIFSMDLGVLDIDWFQPIRMHRLRSLQSAERICRTFNIRHYERLNLARSALSLINQSEYTICGPGPFAPLAEPIDEPP